MNTGSALRAANGIGAVNNDGPEFPIVASNSSDTALSLFNSARKQKKSPEVCFYLGAMLQAQGRLEEAVAHYQKALNLGWKKVALYSNLGLALSDLGQHKNAVDVLRLALCIEPNHTYARQNLGVALQATGQFDEAKANYWQVLALQPNRIEVLGNLADVFRIQGALAQAEECLRLGLAVQPDHLDLLLDLGVVLQAASRFDEAEDCFRRVLSIDAKNANAHNNLGTILYAQGRLTEADACYRCALSIDPGNSDAQNNIGIVELAQGRLAEAAESYQRAITIKPNFTRAHFNYVQSRKITQDDKALIAHLEGLVDSSGLGAEEQTDVHFALGKCYDDLGIYEQAFAHYKNGHNLERRKYAFDPIQYVNTVSKLIATFDRGFFTQRPAFGSSSKVPVFIVGMPRSGTTLVEQIISSHPHVFGAGELYFLDDRFKGLPPDSIGQMESPELLALVDEYLTHLRTFSPNALHITDKMPQNFLHLGLIRLCFPHARIIHCKRNPLDTCLSIYSQKFVSAHPYAHDLNNLALYYAQYERLMQHWKEVLPGKMFEVQYEDLVADQGTTTRKLIEFCNLEWDDKCLAFDRNERVVHTASNWQVRQPMYSSSIGRWRHYQEFLGPLMQLDAGICSGFSGHSLAAR